MEFITAEQFLKQDKEVQKVFIDWWEPKFGDLYSCDNHRILKVIDEDIESELKEDKDFLKHTIYCFNSLKDKIIPLFTEGQLRKFIEDKSSDFDLESEAVIEIEFYTKEDLEDKVTQKEIGYLIEILDKSDGLLIDCYFDLGTDLLQAYWKVAVQIAKEESFK